MEIKQSQITLLTIEITEELYNKLPTYDLYDQLIVVKYVKSLHDTHRMLIGILDALNGYSSDSNIDDILEWVNDMITWLVTYGDSDDVVIVEVKT